MDDARDGPNRALDGAVVGPASGARCLHRVARERDAGPSWWRTAPLDEGVRLRAMAAADRRAGLRERALRHAGPEARVVDVVGDHWTDLPGDVPGDDDEAATRRALSEGATLVWGAALPADHRSGRVGLRCTLAAVPGGGHAPVLVVNHKVVDPRRSRRSAGALVTRLLDWDPAPDPTLRLRRHPADLDRLAHAWHLLDVLGHAAPTPVGAVLGLGSARAVVHDLEPVLPAADRNHATRLAVVRGELATAPSRIGECRTCPWWEGWDDRGTPVEGCRDQLVVADDVSLVVGGGQVGPLRAAGVRTVAELAEAGPERPPDWNGEPFSDAVLRARAHRDGEVVVPKVARPAIPRADIEVDVDLESHLNDGAYLWGVLLTLRDGRRLEAEGYRPFVTWARLPDPDEGRSFAEFWRWLTGIRDRAAGQGRTFRAYCYSRSAENAWMLSTATRFGPDGTSAVVRGVPSVAEVRDFISSPQWVDVHEAVATQFVSTSGLGLKVVAPVSGFHWRDPEAGGEASIGWYRDAQASRGVERDSGRERILAYNEDDVRATRAVREWISSRL
ncbi:TM0106 family RecB-like putative nuclease [Dietzia sp. PP-33]|jgi:predicted RecB family nuclease|uniref:TM0106 family RecB-like putative nuclease n=1 Tax=Dietzia sp. PP-33 TaxID=2957500 RepID=UPI0029AAFAE7|nr:TM0106 family RecB-like putative nuclease [Dietzia sp. PP-33]MDX2357867.1 TM0106 family RecB-like putative nuclease [Dietzia sp. PP-33]